jgi:hypothetical protein
MGSLNSSSPSAGKPDLTKKFSTANDKLEKLG